MWRIKYDGTMVPLNENDDKIIWVPTQDVAFHRAKFPTKNRSLQTQTAPFVLEDQIIGIVDQQHFALAKQEEDDGHVMTAVVATEIINQWMATIISDKASVRTIYPDVFAVPYTDGVPVVWHEEGRSWLRFGINEGTSGSLEWILELVNMQNWGAKIKVYSDDIEALPEDWQSAANALPAPLDNLMQEEIGDSPDVLINLMQGEYAPNSELSRWLIVWKRVGIAAGLFLALYLGHSTVESERLRAQTDALRQETISLLKNNGLPSQISTQGLRGQVKRYVEEVAEVAQKQKGGIWSVVLDIEPLLSACKPCVVEQIDFDGEQMIVVVNAVSLEEFETGLQGVPRARYERTDFPNQEDGRQRARFRIKVS